jgi:hypothetical protein
MRRPTAWFAVAIAVAGAVQLLVGRVGWAQDLAPPPQPQPQPTGPPYLGYPPPLAGMPPPFGPPMGLPAPIVVLRADSPQARLQVQTALNWQDVCPSPCGVAVHPAGVYRIGGRAIQPSEAFQLPRPSGQIAIDARTESKTKHWVGLGMLLGGVAGALLGAVFYSAASNLGPDVDGSYSTRNMDRIYSGGVVLTGVVVSVIGIVLMQSRTSVEIR